MVRRGTGAEGDYKSAVLILFPGLFVKRTAAVEGDET